MSPSDGKAAAAKTTLAGPSWPILATSRGWGGATALSARSAVAEPVRGAGRREQSTSALEGIYAPLAAALIADEDEPPTTELVEILNFVDLGILDLGILDAVDPSAYKRRFFAPCVLHVLTEDA